MLAGGQVDDPAESFTKISTMSNLLQAFAPFRDGEAVNGEAKLAIADIIKAMLNVPWEARSRDEV